MSCKVLKHNQFIPFGRSRAEPTGFLQQGNLYPAHQIRRKVTLGVPGYALFHLTTFLRFIQRLVASFITAAALNSPANIRPRPLPFQRSAPASTISLPNAPLRSQFVRLSSMRTKAAYPRFNSSASTPPRSKSIYACWQAEVFQTVPARQDGSETHGRGRSDIRAQPNRVIPYTHKGKFEVIA